MAVARATSAESHLNDLSNVFTSGADSWLRGRDVVRRLWRLAALAVVATAGAAWSCGDPSASNEPAPAAELLRLPLTAAEVLSWPHRQEVAADLDGDRQLESAVLAADVHLSDGGRPLWEDGHRWGLVIVDGANSTLVFSAFVPRGFVEAAILRPSSSGAREVHLQERTPEQLRSIAIAYEGPGRARAASAAYYETEQWLPGSARLHD